jgi:hypothetical protein
MISLRESVDWSELSCLLLAALKQAGLGERRRARLLSSYSSAVLGVLSGSSMTLSAEVVGNSNQPNCASAANAAGSFNRIVELMIVGFESEFVHLAGAE